MSDPAAISNIALMRNDEKLAEAIRRSLPHLPAEVRHHVLALLDPTSLAIITATLLIWGGSHWLGLGELVDVCLVVLGFGFLGMGVFAGARELRGFAREAVQAQTDSDLDRAAHHFARAVTILGLSALSALLLRKNTTAAASPGGPRVTPPLPSARRSSAAARKNTSTEAQPSAALSDAD